MTDGPRLIGRKEAAAYCGIGESTFSLWVKNHKMPKPVPGTRKWDKKAIDARLDEISGLAAPSATEDPFDAWERKAGRKKDEDRPIHGLDKRVGETLMAMSYNTDLNTLDLLPGAGPATMRLLVSKKLVTAAPEGKYLITEEGHAEAVRILAQMMKR